MEQMSFIKDNLKESITKQLKKAISKGIVPGAIVIFDNDKLDRNIVKSLYVGNENKLEAALISESGCSFIGWPALSERLTVVGFKEI